MGGALAYELIDELNPSVAAVLDDIVVDLKIRLVNQQSRLNCQAFSTGFNSGRLGGNRSRVILAGTSSAAETSHPA